VLLALWKWRPARRAVIGAMAAGLVASLAMSLVVTPLQPAAAFYLLPTRAWEILAGGLVYLLAHQCFMTRRQRMGLEAVGLALVILAVAAFDATSQWPGWRALVPVAGTACVLLAARSSSAWTGNVIAQWLGTRSYSLYLWHWPLQVALTYLGWATHPGAIAAGLLLTLVMGALSYRLVETPARLQLTRLRWGRGGIAGRSGCGCCAWGLGTDQDECSFKIFRIG